MDRALALDNKTRESSQNGDYFFFIITLHYHLSIWQINDKSRNILCTKILYCIYKFFEFIMKL